MAETATLTLPRPDDWHLHLRDGPMLDAVLPATAAVFARAIIMPNLVPPVTTTASATAYRERILAALPAGPDFEPLMTCYLQDQTDPDDLERGQTLGVFTAAKLYPAHATTNASFGVSAISAIYPVLERMQRIDLPLLIHGEVTDPEVDIFDREAVFIERVLAPLRRDFPELRMVLEHVTSAEGAGFVRDAGPKTAGTLTPQHLAHDRNALLVGGIRPHLYCLPILKRRRDLDALRAVVREGCPRFFLGTDSAPHAVHAKENACGCAGVFSAPVALEVYAELFEGMGCLDRLADFASRNGAHFYGLPINEGNLTLTRAPWTPPARVPVAGPEHDVIVYRGGEQLKWRLQAPSIAD